MSYSNDDSWFAASAKRGTNLLVVDYLDEYVNFINEMTEEQKRKECISGYNRVRRIQLWSSENLRIEVKPGDICYLDYGQVFTNEAGYQHFGLVVSKFNYKIFVIPMTSNPAMVQKARNLNPPGREHLYHIGQIEGLNKPSVLFLNDCKYINSSRIISVNAHIDPRSEMFQEILQYISQGIFGEFMIK